MMRPRPMTEPRLPHSRSTGWVLFSRLGCRMSSKGWSKWLGCVSSFLWCFVYFSNMTSWTCGIFKSSCRVKLDTYRGALVIMRRNFDCAFCSTAWLDLLAQPQISMPYVQIVVFGSENQTDSATMLWPAFDPGTIVSTACLLTVERLCWKL